MTVERCPYYVIALLQAINTKLRIKWWNKYQEEMASPFENTSNKFSNDTFSVEAYSWEDEDEQSYNFKWKDIEISWYKHLGRGTTINKHITPERAIEMFDDCTKSLDNL